MASYTLKTIDQIAPYEGPSSIEGIQFRPAASALGIQAWGMNVLELAPHCTGYPEHDHKTDGHEEAYVVLRGSAILHVAGEQVPVRQGEIVRVDGAARRKFITEDEGVCLLAIGATPGKAYAPSMGG